MRNKRVFAVLVLGFFVPAGLGWAHKPIVVDGGPTTSSTAYLIADPSVSQVAYHECTPPQPELWFTFYLEANTTLYLQTGVAKIDRYASVRPAMVLLGPGLPAVEVPFTVPAGYGGIVFTTEGITPEEFHEEFTGTDSWLFPAQEPMVREAGRYYLAGYIPGGREGKFWMAIGKKEAFGFKDIVTLPKVLFEVRSFHETGPFGGLLFWAMALAAVFAAGLLFSAFFVVSRVYKKVKAGRGHAETSAH